jgi:formylglycine-generating enzyme required for sulfatase activity
MLSWKLRGIVCSVSLLVWAAPSPGAEPPLLIDLGGGVKLEMVLVPAGKFTQGSPAAESGRGDDEAQREVTLGRGFYLGKHEVTRGQFARFVQETSYRTEAEKGKSGGSGFDGKGLTQRPEFNWKNPGFAQGDDHPVVLVTYDDAQAFLAWLQTKAQRAVFLPSEAQWEYAARAGSTSRFYKGDPDGDARAIAWIKDNAGNGTHPIGQKPANRWGFFDMSGNAYEWCRDWYAPYTPGSVTDPEETRSTLSDKPRRVLRGGSWLKEARHVRSAARYRNTPGSRNADNGFRAAASIERGAPVSALATTPHVSTTVRPEPAGSGSTSASGSSGIWGYFKPLLWLAAALFVIRLLFRKRGTPAGYPDVRVRPGPDGFWLDAPKVAVGSTIRYKATVEGTSRTGEVKAERGPSGKGQFIYTGGAPTAVEILGVSVAAGLVAGALTRTLPRSPTTTSRSTTYRDHDPTPFRGFPSAY